MTKIHCMYILKKNKLYWKMKYFKLKIFYGKRFVYEIVFILQCIFLTLFQNPSISKHKYFKIQIFQNTSISNYIYFKLQIFQNTNISKYKYFKKTNILNYKYFKIQIFQSTNISKIQIF